MIDSKQLTTNTTKALMAFVAALVLAFACQVAGAEKAYAGAQMDKVISAADSFPAVTNLKWTDYAKVGNAFDRVDIDAATTEFSNEKDSLSADKKERYANAVLKMLDADARIDALVNAEKNKAAKVKGPKPKVKVGKKKAKVSWKKLSGKYKYQVYCSKKKSKGYELAATTTKNKATVKYLKKGKKYYFKILPVRIDIPTGSCMTFWMLDEVPGKYSAAVKSKKIK